MATLTTIGRLAPSPTGAQHVGNARTYLIAWLSARSQGGRVVLRIEDIDSPRIKAGAAEQACEDLRWLGLDWDGEPIVQTQRLPLYEAALARLREQELVYPCTCTRGDIERAASAPHLEHEGPVYPGTCAGRSARDVVPAPFAWRFRVPRDPVAQSFDVLGIVDFLEIHARAIAAHARELTGFIEHKCDSSRHARGEVLARVAQTDHEALGHVLAAVIADTFDDRRRT